jgi:hypothetical protein
MAFITVTEASAESAIGTDLMDGERLQTSALPRRVVQMGIGGSTAVGDCAVDLFYGSEFVARVYNTTTNNAIKGEEMINIPGILVCAPNEPIHLFVHDAGHTNVMVVQLGIQEIMPRKPAYKGRSFRR